MEATTHPKRRKPWLAVLLSLVCTGLGQLYNGQWRKGALLYVVELAAGLGMIVGFRSFGLMLAMIGGLLLFNVAVAVDAYRTARQRAEYRLMPFNRGWVYVLILVLNFSVGIGLEWSIQANHFQTYKVPSGSMIPTLRVGDHFMAEQLDRGDALERGDVVVFEMPDIGKHFVKRVVGLPGETLSIRDKRVSVDGRELAEPYAQHTKPGILPLRDTYGPLTLKPDEFFLMGDNREASYDSRWIGPVEREHIEARALYLYFPAVGEPEWSSRLGASVR